tara:strand:- start:5781 stop:7895 length:2115 start_codon:yes stop_codon:yes gene_type:complete
MKICQINPGCGIEIPPKGWGAIEKIVWEFTQNLREQGHQVDIKWTNEVQKGEYDLVHVHVANLALILAEKGIPYIFQCHDHHAFHYGKNSSIFKQNLEAIEKSTISILPAKYLVDYFESDKAVYFSHGVDTEFFTPDLKEKPHKLLMVANNGLGGADAHDRKGFTEGIKAALIQNLPITIAGPKNNQNFIESNPWVKKHNINWVFNPNQEELLSLFQSHTIFLHPSELEAGHPNLTILEAMACGLPVVGCMEDSLEGMILSKKSPKSISKGIDSVLKNYKNHSLQALNTANKLSWKNRSIELLKLFPPVTMKDILIKEYSNTKKFYKPPTLPKAEFHLSFLRGAKCDIQGNTSSSYKVEFINSDTDEILWQDTIKCGMWTSCNKTYFIPWKIQITDLSTQEITVYNYSLKDEKVYIHLDSKSVGDTIAWFPYVEEFRKKHNCEVICSTFHNDWFESKYPQLNFVPPGTNVTNIKGHFNIGWFYTKEDQVDLNQHPQNFQQLPLAQTCADILGIKYKEIKSKLAVISTPDIKEDYVVIAPHATKHCAYWNHPGGWQTIIDYLNSKNYKVVMSSIEPLGDNWHDSKLGGTLTGIIDRTANYSMEKTFSLIQNSKGLIGLSSGLCWVSWALNIPTIMISGHSDPILEPQSLERITTPTGYCTGCHFKHKLDPGDWEWCPEHKNTDRHFECTKSITPKMVIESINKIL